MIYEYVCRVKFAKTTPNRYLAPMNIAFTGHREFNRDRFEGRLYRRVLELSQNEPCTFWSGMAMGFDLSAAEAVLKARDWGADIRLNCVIPYIGQSLFYNDDDTTRYESILRRADSVVTLAEEYNRDVYFRRNDYLIEHAEHIIAYFDGNLSSGGTAYTIRNARRAGVPIENIYPQQQLSLF